MPSLESRFREEVNYWVGRYNSANAELNNLTAQHSVVKKEVEELANQYSSAAKHIDELTLQIGRLDELETGVFGK